MSGKRLRFLRGALFAFAGLLALLLVVRWEEKWRAARLLARTEAELRAAGERLDYEDFIPPPVPEAENFATAPIVVKLLRVTKPGVADLSAEDGRLAAMSLSHVGNRRPMPWRGQVELGHAVDLGQWSRDLRGRKSSPNEKLESGAAAQDVLQWFQQWTPEMTEIATAAHRPAARFALHYERGDEIDLSHGNLLVRLAGLYSLRASAALGVGDSALALQDLETLHRLQRALQPEPLLISELMRMTVMEAFQQPLWEGLTQHAWKAEQLRLLQEMLEENDLLADYPRVVRGERAFLRLNFTLIRKRRLNISQTLQALFPLQTVPDSVGRFAPFFTVEAILNQNEAACERLVQDFVLPVVDPVAGKIDRAKVNRLDEVIHAGRPTFYNFVSTIGFPIYAFFTRRVGMTAVALDQARVACALERFRLANRRLPAELRELVPTYLSTVPEDVLGSQPLYYRLAPAGSYHLYSVGWNQTDDGGSIVSKSDGTRRDDEKGDWVWLSAPR